jgi:hypothetical protein
VRFTDIVSNQTGDREGEESAKAPGIIGLSGFVFALCPVGLLRAARFPSVLMLPRKSPIFLDDLASFRQFGSSRDDEVGLFLYFGITYRDSAAFPAGRLATYPSDHTPTPDG